MITQAASGLGAWGILPIVIAVACAGGFFWFIRQRAVVIALAFALVGAVGLAIPVVLNIKSVAANRPFEVVVANDRVSLNGFLHHHGIGGGTYTAPDGRVIPLSRAPDWPRVATIIINDSERLLTLRRYHYASSSSVSAGSPLLQVVFPGETAVIEGSVDMLEEAGTPPPRSLKSDAPVDTLDILYRSRQTYDESRDGDRQTWLSKRERP